MTINCKGNLLDLSTPVVMGIINITPDSFYDGGKYKNEADIIAQVKTMLTNGASLIDIGAYSSRPGADHVDEEEELGRIIPIVKLLLKAFPEILLSIDTFRSRVADECLNLGAAIINDISAGNLDSNMLPVVGKHRAPYIMMHMKGTPGTMQGKTNYENLLGDIRYYFSEKVAEARTYGIKDIIIDPGFGFSKTMEQNYEILKKLELLHALDLPILVGISRKSMIYRLLKTTPENALNGSTALHMYALNKGAHILRAHDVKEAMECIRLFNAIDGTSDH
ncbi:dihydropteroate synthase [Arenibacter sp. F20364]|uniref:dihydropteroate synthase n=1 Tax=Arenibacter sp. F20364 TaxID=2926415 RepID=UPI001FF4A143|nr:dihydropteroate synthase [Arenibacter sp. F20364]MCK0188367.1 dihydropteroate synthase [Arenibacter sp. F20364]